MFSKNIVVSVFTERDNSVCFFNRVYIFEGGKMSDYTRRPANTFLRSDNETTNKRKRKA